MPGVLGVSPKGHPLTSAERMRLKRLRDKGLAPPVASCKSCGKTLKFGAGPGEAYSLGLCFECFRQTPEGIEFKGRTRPRVRAVRGVGYWSGKPGEPLVKHQRLRAAIGYAFVSRKGGNGPVFVLWSTGQVTEHRGLTAFNSQGLQPDHWSAQPDPPADLSWFELPEPKPLRLAD